MPNALAFIGGGLLQGAGKALLEEERETGKAKRERQLADLEHKRGLERDEKKLEGKAKFERVLAEIEQKNALELKLAPGAPNRRPRCKTAPCSPHVLLTWVH